MHTGDARADVLLQCSLCIRARKSNKSAANKGWDPDADAGCAPTPTIEAATSEMGSVLHVDEECAGALARACQDHRTWEASRPAFEKKESTRGVI